MFAAITAYNVEVAALNRRNALADQIVCEVHVVLWVIFVPLTMQWEIDN